VTLSPIRHCVTGGKGCKAVEYKIALPQGPTDDAILLNGIIAAIMVRWSLYLKKICFQDSGTITLRDCGSCPKKVHFPKISMYP
jgi:hypothetical protein